MDSRKRVALSCDLSALDVAQRKRRFLLYQLLQVDIVELPDGYAFHVDPVALIAQHLEELAALERRCCPFLTIALRAGTADTQLVLEIGRGDAVKEFIAAEFGIRKHQGPERRWRIWSAHELEWQAPAYGNWSRRGESLAPRRRCRR
jgi:hypothetical protein